MPFGEGVDSSGSKNHVLDEVQTPRKGNFGVVRPLKTLKALPVTAAALQVRCKKINNGITAPLPQRTACCRQVFVTYYLVSCVKPALCNAAFRQNSSTTC